jgi:hypothetical protein
MFYVGLLVPVRGSGKQRAGITPECSASKHLDEREVENAD